jgi:hypothetical protein
MDFHGGPIMASGCMLMATGLLLVLQLLKRAGDSSSQLNPVPVPSDKTSRARSANK